MFVQRLRRRLWAEQAAGRGRFRVSRARSATAAADPSPIHAGSPDPKAALAQIADRVRSCQRCPLGGLRTNAVPGEGNATADLLFVGEAPGREEDAAGRPFIGPAGQLLSRMIAAMGLSREQVFITNVLKCRPPGNRDPQPAEIAACRDYLRRQLAITRPRVVIALGSPATRWFLGPSAGVMSSRGRVTDLADYQVVPTFHPSYLLRFPSEKRKAWADLQLAMGLLGLPLPRRSG